MLLEFVDVAKVYKGGLRGVDGVSMRLGAGLVGLLGPNGAGKSSLMRIAATVTRPTSGRVLFDGTDTVTRPDPLRRNLGYLPQDFGVYPHLSAAEFLSYLAAVKGMPARAARARIGELLELLDLADAGRRPLGKYSGGMLRRVGIAQALLADPRVLIVDEPTAGLDPEQRVMFRNRTVPVLRSGAGNIAWFLLWMIFAIAGAGVPLGFGAVTTSMRQAMAAQHLHPAEFSVGFTKVDHPLRTFTWHGIEPPGGFTAVRLVLIVAAVGLAVLPAVWFGRFDPARGRPRGVPAPDSSQAPDPVPATPEAAGQAARPARSPAYKPLSPAAVRPGLAFGRLLAGEVRILVQGISRWWWLVAAALTVAGLAVPASLVKPAGASTALLLSAAWIWPVLIWSRLGVQRRENGLETLLGAYPAARWQLAAEWAAGLALTAMAGLGPLLRMAVAADGPGVAAWIAGAVFIPSLALLLGTASRTHRTFQALYVILWYAAVNQLAAADYMGTVLVNGRPAGPSPLLTAGIGIAMLAVTFTIRAAQHTTR